MPTGYYPDTTQVASNPDEIGIPEAQTETPSTLAMLLRKLELKSRVKLPIEREWLVNAAFLRGQHFLVWNLRAHRLEQPVSDQPWKIRLAINYLLPWYMRTLSKLTTGEPRWHVKPITMDQKDISKAKCASKLLEFYWNEFSLDEIVRDWEAWALECGPSFLKLTYNTEIDEHEISIVSPYEMFVDPGCIDPDLKTARWVLQERWVQKTTLTDQHPDKAHMIQGGGPSPSIYSMWRLRPVAGPEGIWSQDLTMFEANQKGEEYVQLIEYWEAVSKAYPRGRYVLATKDVILHDGPNPYAHKQFPYIPIHNVRTPGQFWSPCVLSQAIPLQRNINRNRSQTVEIRNLVLNPQIIWPMTGRIEQNQWTNQPGRIIKYIPGLRGEKPEFILPSIPSGYWDERNASKEDLFDVLSYHETSQGKVPKNLQSGRGISLLQSGDDTVLGTQMKELEKGLAKLGRMLLWNTAQYYTDPRIIQVVGETGLVESMAFKGSEVPMVMGQPPMIEVAIGSSWPRDRVAIRSEIFELIQMGLLDPQDPKSRARIAMMLRLRGYPEEEMQEDLLDEQWAQQENEMLKRGMPAQAQYFENHHIHLRQVNILRKSTEYRTGSPQARSLIDTHASEHEQMLQSQFEQIQGIEGGGPPEGASSHGARTGGSASPEEAAAGSIKRHVQGSRRGEPRRGLTPEAENLEAETEAVEGGGPGITTSG